MIVFGLSCKLIFFKVFSEMFTFFPLQISVHIFNDDEKLDFDQAKLVLKVSLK